MIKFTCANCGRAIRTGDEQAGKRCKCPACRQVLEAPFFEQQVSKDASAGSLQFKTQPAQTEYLDESSAALIGQMVTTAQEQPPDERKFPWLIDIFLYPFNKSGLVMFAVFLGVPLVFKVLSWFMELGMLSLPALLPFYLFVGIIGWIVKAIIVLYMYWYLAECIRASADGRIRAPDTTAITPGLMEIIWQLFKILPCLLLFGLPAMVYFYNVRKTDAVFYALTGVGAFLFPMALLSVIMFDSLSGLNPIVIVGSIFSTFFSYLATTAFLFVFAALSVIAVGLIGRQPILGSIATALMIYLMMIGAHILGRFYFRYEQKLYWEV